eukprot:8564486-Pyramimonas_sp.AAC.1
MPAALSKATLVHMNQTRPRCTGQAKSCEFNLNATVSWPISLSKPNTCLRMMLSGRSSIPATTTSNMA